MKKLHEGLTAAKFYDNMEKKARLAGKREKIVCGRPPLKG